MLTIRVGETESFDEAKSEFVETVAVDSEARAFSGLACQNGSPNTRSRSSVRKRSLRKRSSTTSSACVLDPKIAPEEFSTNSLRANFKAINEYIDAKMTATWFSDQPAHPRSREVITAELIYYWMTVFNIPFECEQWHLNRLFTLIRVCNIKQAKPKKMSRSEMPLDEPELNAQRKAQLGTTG